MTPWRTIEVCGLEWDVVFSTAAEFRAAGLPSAWGYCDYEAHRIHLRHTLRRKPGVLRDVLLHELCHALLESSGLGRHLQAATGLDDEPFVDWEENFIRLLVPHVGRLIDSIGDAWRVS